MINQKLLETYIDNGFNILLQGKHGVGKTAILTQACKNMGLRLKYYSASSLDPYTDLVGVPKFVTLDNGQEVLKSVRPQEINEAEVVFFDELNRADPKVLNAVFELIQFGSINGEKLPNLKCVIAAQNPPEDNYVVDPLDPALADRFQICLEIKPEVSVSYLKTVLKEETAESLVRWHKDHTDKAEYISPRRLEMIGKVWEATEDRFSLVAAMPAGGTFDVGKLYNMLVDADFDEDMNILLTTEGIRDNLRQMGQSRVLTALQKTSGSTREKMLANISVGLSDLFGPRTIVEYLQVIDMMNEDQIDTVISTWRPGKKNRIFNEDAVQNFDSMAGVETLRRKISEQL